MDINNNQKEKMVIILMVWFKEWEFLQLLFSNIHNFVGPNTRCSNKVLVPQNQPHK